MMAVIAVFFTALVTIVVPVTCLYIAAAALWGRRMVGEQPADG